MGEDGPFEVNQLRSGQQTDLLGQHPPVLSHPAQLVEPGGLGPTRLPTIQGGQRFAGEQGQRLVQTERGPLRVAGIAESRRPLHQVLESDRVDLIVADDQPVAVRCGLDGLLAQRPTQPHDRPLHHLAPRRWRIVAVESGGQAVRGG